MLQFAFVVFAALIVQSVNAQEDLKFRYERVKQQCSGLPLETRARVSVTRFNVTTRTSDGTVDRNVEANNTLKALNILAGGGQNAPRADETPPILGDNLSTMLTNALQEVACFRVLESLKNKDDYEGEVKQATSSMSSKNAPKAGLQLGAQLVVIGEVVEYSDRSKGVNVMGVGSKKRHVKMGFNLKMVNPETRDVVASKLFRVESKTGKSVSVFGIVSTDVQDPAIAAVLEDGVVQAVEFISKVRDSLNITVSNIPGSNSSTPNGSSAFELTISNTNYAAYNQIATTLTSIPKYKGAQKSFSNGVGSFVVECSGSTEDFMNALIKKLGNKFEVVGIDANKLELKSN